MVRYVRKAIVPKDFFFERINYQLRFRGYSSGLFSKLERLFKVPWRHLEQDGIYVCLHFLKLAESVKDTSRTVI